MSKSISKYSISFLLVLLAMQSPVSAQMVSDSLVQLVSYWSVGDKYEFRNEQVKALINGNDTTVTEKSAALVTLEVIEETDSTYTVRYDSGDYQHSDYLRMKMVESIDKNIGPMPVDIITNQLGQPQTILPLSWETISDKVIDGCVAEVMERLDGASIDREQLEQWIRTLISPAVVQQSVEAEIVKLFQFHGRRYEIGTHYEYEIAISNMFDPSGDGIPVHGEFWVSRENTNEEMVEFCVYQRADPAILKDVAVEYLKSTGIDVDNDEAKRSLASISYELSDIMVYRYHLGTGWPLYIASFRDVLSFKDGELARHDYTEESFTILL